MTAEEFKRVFLPHAITLRQAALRLTGQQDVADDLVQETFLLLWTKRDRLGRISDSATYALGVLHNVHCSSLRRRSLETTDLDEARFAEATIDNDGADIQQLISQLPEPGRTILRLRDLEELPYDEIARLLRTSEGNVRVILCRARRLLREIWRQEMQ